MRARLLRAGIAAAGAAGLALWHARGDAGGGSDHPGRSRDAAAVTTGAEPRSPAPPWPRPLLRPPRIAAARATSVTVGGVTIEGAGVFDPEAPEVKANLFEFKKSRLRFALYDAAADCWSGGDDVADLEVTYTMIVEGEILRLENVKLTDSTLPDPAIEACIIGRLRELRSPAADIPDLREDGSSWISLHDLFTRNRRQR